MRYRAGAHRVWGPSGRSPLLAAALCSWLSQGLMGAEVSCLSPGPGLCSPSRAGALLSSIQDAPLLLPVSEPGAWQGCARFYGNCRSVSCRLCDCVLFSL